MCLCSDTSDLCSAHFLVLQLANSWCLTAGASSCTVCDTGAYYGSSGVHIRVFLFIFAKGWDFVQVSAFQKSDYYLTSISRLVMVCKCAFSPFHQRNLDSGSLGVFMSWSEARAYTAGPNAAYRLTQAALRASPVLRGHSARLTVTSCNLHPKLNKRPKIFPTLLFMPFCRCLYLHNVWCRNLLQLSWWVHSCAGVHTCKFCLLRRLPRKNLR